MKSELFEMVFEVTKTCQNGNEQVMKKSVFSERFLNGRFYAENERIAKATELLKSKHYYNINYIGTKAVSLLVI